MFEREHWGYEKDATDILVEDLPERKRNCALPS